MAKVLLKKNATNSCRLDDFVFLTYFSCLVRLTQDIIQGLKHVFVCSLMVKKEALVCLAEVPLAKAPSPVILTPTHPMHTYHVLPTACAPGAGSWVVVIC